MTQADGQHTYFIRHFLTSVFLRQLSMYTQVYLSELALGITGLYEQRTPI